MTTQKDKNIIKNKELSETQLQFLEFCKEFGWGKIEVTVVNGEPVGSKELERTHRHDVKVR